MSFTKGTARPGTSTAIPGPVAFEVRLSSTSIFGAAAVTKQLTASVFDHFGVAFAGATVTWSTTNAAVATVSGTGLVTFVGTGSCVIRATVAAARASKDCLVGVPTL